MYDSEIIDSHMHLWDLKNNYAWLNEPIPELEKMLGDYSSLRKNFLIQDYLALAKKNDITKSIHVEAFGFPENPVNESKWLQEIADQHGFPNGIVAHAQLQDPNIDQTLSEHAQYNNVRGVRMPLNWHELPYLRMTDRPDYMQDENWLNGFSLLQRYKLSFDLQICDHQLPEAETLAKQFPDTSIILEHLGWPTDLSETGFSHWKKRLKKIASCNNVSIKLSGVGAVFQHKVSDTAIQRYIQEAIHLFGVERCLFGSNFPPDGLFYSFTEVVDLVKKSVVHLTEQEQRKIFYDNAHRIYRLES